MVPHVRLLAGTAFLSLTLVGCHGSSSSSVLPASIQRSGTASFSVFVPAPNSGAPTPQSLSVLLLQANGASPSTKAVAYNMNLTASTHGCTALAGGALSCTATVSAPVGSDTFALTTYSGLNGMGTQIAKTQAKASVSAATATTKCTPMPAMAPVTRY
jgi:hypothetical protein